MAVRQMREGLESRVDDCVRKVQNANFYIEDRIIKVETYKEQILQNTENASTLQRAHTEIVHKFNSKIDDIAMKTLKQEHEYKRQLDKINYVLEDLPQ